MFIKIDNLSHPLRDREIIENFSEFLAIILAGGASHLFSFLSTQSNNGLDLYVKIHQLMTNESIGIEQDYHKYQRH
jgi:hypothetical protein